ncbi:MAG TPA: hypothetical protein VE046_02150 [Steroidobacteraceae bacterium]|nr:hypothetical protein [Steroidobacteraceae bacterium]
MHFRSASCAAGREQDLKAGSAEKSLYAPRSACLKALKIAVTCPVVAPMSAQISREFNSSGPHLSFGAIRFAKRGSGLDVASLVLKFACDKPSGITGFQCRVDGGWRVVATD